MRKCLSRRILSRSSRPGIESDAAAECPEHWPSPSGHRSISGTKGAASRCAAGERESFLAYRPGPEGRKWIIAVSRSYIAPAILTAPVVSSSVMTGLRLRISAMVSSTFFRATASTKP